MKLRSAAPRIACVLLMLGANAACTSGSTAGAGAAGTTSSTSSKTSTTSSKTTTTGAGGMGPVCPGKGFGGGETLAVGGSVTATILDQNGAPFANQPIFICGIDLCSPMGKTAADGTATISTTLMMKKPAFKFGDQVLYPELAIPLSMMTNDFLTIGTGKLPAAGAPIVAGADATSAGVTLSVPKGDNVQFNTLVYGTPDKQVLKAVAIPVAKAQAVLTPMNLGFEMLWGIAPAETTLCPAATVTVPNTPAWPAGTAVEFWVMTTDAGQEFAPYAGWSKMSDGVVSTDGMTVSTSSGTGFNYLDTFGVRKKP